MRTENSDEQDFRMWIGFSTRVDPRVRRNVSLAEGVLPEHARHPPGEGKSPFPEVESWTQKPMSSEGLLLPGFLFGSGHEFSVGPLF